MTSKLNFYGTCCFKAILHLKARLLSMKEHCLGFEKVNWEIKSFIAFFEKIAIEVAFFLQNFFSSHAFLRRRRKKALIRVRNRRDFENGV